MQKKIELINDFFGILKDAIFYIMAAYLLEIFFAFSFIKDLGVLAYFILVPIKAFLYSGIYGSLTEIMSGEEINFTFPRFVSNAKQFWLQYLFFSVTLSIVLQGLRSVDPGFFYSGPIVSNFDLITMLIMAFFISNKKYHRLVESSARSRLNAYQIFILIILLMLNVLTRFFQLHLHGVYFGLNRAILLLLKYLHFASLLYLVYIIQQRYPSIKGSFNKKNNIFFINPVDGGICRSALYPVYDYNLPTFTVLKALTTEKYDVRVFNKVPWENRYYEKSKLAAISCTTSNSYEAYKIAKEFKKRGATVIMGGHHVSHMPQEALEYCDSVVIGYAEEAWKEALTDHENNSLKSRYFKNPQNVFTEEIHKKILTFPDKEIRDSLELTRGCKYRCDFCPLHSFGNSNLQRAPVNFLIERINKIKHKFNKLVFNDSNIYCDPTLTKRFLEALIPLKIKWQSFCSIDIAEDERILKLLKESGCEGLAFGFESHRMSEEFKKGGKYAFSAKQVEYARKVKKKGILVQISYILGFDSDRLIDVFKILKECLQIWPKQALAGFLVPIPGSDSYINMMKDDRFSDLNWKNFHGFKLVFDHDNIGKKQSFILYFFIRLVIPYASRNGSIFFSLALLFLILLIKLIY